MTTPVRGRGLAAPVPQRMGTIEMGHHDEGIEARGTVGGEHLPAAVVALLELAGLDLGQAKVANDIFVDGTGPFGRVGGHQEGAIVAQHLDTPFIGSQLLRNVVEEVDQD